MSTRVTILLAVVVGVLGGTLISGSALVGASATATSVPALTASSPTTGQPNRCVLGRLPAKLRADLLAARSLPVAERRAAVRKILKAARAGHYGKRAQQIVERRALRKAIRHQLPAQLRADLKQARHLPADERRPALKQIRKDALAGKYGELVKTLVEKRKEHQAACRSANKSASTA